MKFKLLKDKNFLLLMLGKLTSLLGSNMIQFALSLYVLAITGSALQFASMLSISILPRLLLSPFAGVLGDWFDRKKMIVTLDFITGTLIATYATIFFATGGISLLLIYVFVIILEAIEIFFGAAMGAVIPSMVKKEELLEANSLQSLVLNIGQLLAPTLASIVYGFFGMQIILIVTSICFILSALSEIFIKIPRVGRKSDYSLKTFKTDFVEGFKIMKGSKFILTIVGLVAIINFTISPLFSVGMTFVVKEVLKTSDFQFGIYQTIFAVASITGPIVLSIFRKKLNYGKLLFLSFLLMGLTVLFIALVPSGILINNMRPDLVPFIILLALSFLIGIEVTIVNITIGTIFAHIVPLEAMGRCGSVLTLASTLLIPIGQVTFGFLFDKLAASYVIIICGIILVAAVLIYRNRLLNIAETLKTEEEEKNEIPVHAQLEQNL